MTNGAILNVSRFIADSLLAVPALRREVKTGVATDAEIERRYREFRKLWQRAVISGRVNERSTKARTLADLHAPLLATLGFEGSLRAHEVELDPERVALSVLGESGEHVLVDPLPYGVGPDDRLPAGEFRGSAQRRMERALSASGTRFGLILGGTRWRLVQLDTANEPRYLEFDLDTLADDDPAGFGVFATVVSPAFLLGETPQLDGLLQKSDALGTEVSEKLGPAARRALERLLEGVRADEVNAAWTSETFKEGESLQEIHREGIYVLYRLLFVLFGEAAVPPALPLDKPLYRNAYSLERLRLAVSADIGAYAENEYGIWESVKALFRLMDRGATTKEFHIPAYNGGLFGSDRAPLLDRAALSDRAFVEMLRELTTVEIGKGKRKTRDRVSFRELGVAQLGAVFEGLLDYEPHIASENLYEVAIGTGKQKSLSFLPSSALAGGNGETQPARVKGQFYLQAWGGQRKSTGAYYTPDVIADYLVREALGPQIEGKSPDEILEISVCDPAMGSGGFLVSATEFLGEAYYQAQVRQGLCDPEDDRADLDRIAAKRIVAEHCIYGVDVNPMAVELAKVSLWLTTLSYDRPLSFFDHHLRCGNALLGAPLRNEKGEITSLRIQAVPSAALQCVDKEASKQERDALKVVAKRNDAELKAMERGGISMFAIDLEQPLKEYARARAELSADDPTQSAQDAVERVRAKERQLRELTQDPSSPFHRLKDVCDLWMAPWFWPHDAVCEPPTTDEHQTLIQEIWNGHAPLRGRAETVFALSQQVAKSHRFFHWEVEFPEVFERGGFHAIVGNPPWETLSPETREFFANYDPRFREYGKQQAIARMRRLREIPEVNFAYRRYAGFSYSLGHFLKASGTYTWYASGNLAKGDLDLFRSFVERDFRAIRLGGRLGQVLKHSIYVNSNCTEIRRRLLTDGSIRQFVVNENRKLVFPIHSSIKVVLLVEEKGPPASSLRCAFFVGKNDDGTERALSKRELEAVLAAPEKHLAGLSVDLVQRLSPETQAFVEVREAADIALLEHLNRIGIPFGHAWEPQYCSELHMTNDSNIFVERESLERIGATSDGMRWSHPTEGEFWPLVEGKHIYQHEFPVGNFHYWVNAKESSRLPLHEGKPVNHYPRLAWRNVADCTNERSVIATVVPARSFMGNSLQSIAGGSLGDSPLRNVEALFNSFVFDWQVRLRGGTNLTHTIINAIFVPSRLDQPGLVHNDLASAQVAVFHSFLVPFELAEHIMKGFPLLDRLQTPLPDERRSTISRDLALAGYAELLKHPRAPFYRDRVDRAAVLGARPFIPATRAETVDEEEVLLEGQLLS